jgi:hypothetical protein
MRITATIHILLNQIDNYMDLLIYRNSNEGVCNSLGLFYSGFEPLGRQEGGLQYITYD